MIEYSKSLAQLIATIEHHSSVKAYKDAEKRLKQLPQLSLASFEMKKINKMLFFFKKLKKPKLLHRPVL